jgi:hypothetical protein
VMWAASGGHVDAMEFLVEEMERRDLADQATAASEAENAQGAEGAAALGTTPQTPRRWSFNVNEGNAAEGRTAAMWAPSSSPHILTPHQSNSST